MKCEMCGRKTMIYYIAYFREDENVVADYKVCAYCVPEEQTEDAEPITESETEKSKDSVAYNCTICGGTFNKPHLCLGGKRGKNDRMD